MGIKYYTYKTIQVVTQNIGFKSIRQSNDKTELGVLRTNKTKQTKTIKYKDDELKRKNNQPLIIHFLSKQ